MCRASLMSEPAAPDVTGKICVIGSGLVEDAIKELFGLN